MAVKHIGWKYGKQYAATITINVDAQYFGKIFYPDMDVDCGECQMLGKTSMEEYLPKVLEALDKYNVKATFFVPGAVIREYENAVKEIVERGHEIGCHGDYHENFGTLTVDEQKRAISNAIETIKEVTGKDPVGFRMPEGEINSETLDIVKQLGLKYSSSLSDDDMPYIHENGLVELPIRWETFDLPYFIFTWDPPMPRGQGRSSNVKDVLNNFNYELEGAKRFGTLVNYQFDPTTAGEQGRIFILETILERLCQDERVWLASCSEIAEYVLE